MNKDLKKEKDKKEINEENLGVEKEELETLLKAIEELEKVKSTRKKEPRNIISIEFGGVFHNNIYINFIFSFILNLTLIYLIIELFSFAEYNDIIYVVILALVYTFFESIYKSYILFHHFKIIIKSLGFIFYIGYVAIFYSLDVYVFGDSFNFMDETFLVAFVAIFMLVRYIIGTMLIKYFRKRNIK